MYKAQFAGVGENVWSGNGLTFDTSAEAADYEMSLLMRWTGVDMARVVTEDVPVREPVELDDERIVASYRKGAES